MDESKKKPQDTQKNAITMVAGAAVAAVVIVCALH